MTDFWEALGRLACNNIPQQQIFAAVPVGALNPQTGQIAVDFPAAAYTMIQELIAPKLSAGCLSLMAAGELLWSLNSPDFRTYLAELPGLINPAAVVDPSKPNYFVTLGILILDSAVRTQLTQVPAEMLVPQVPRLAPTEETQLKALSNSTPFGTKCDLLCTTRWSLACNAKMQYWTGHLHTIGLNSATGV